jgi:hypothetical protein
MAMKRLNSEHYLAITELARPKSERKTHEEIAKICGIARSTLFEWKKEPLFEREYKREIMRVGASKLPEVIENMYKVAAETENAAMAKLILQMNDILTERHEVATTAKGDGIDYDLLEDEISAFGKRIESDD